MGKAYRLVTGSIALFTLVSVAAIAVATAAELDLTPACPDCEISTPTSKSALDNNLGKRGVSGSASDQHEHRLEARVTIQGCIEPEDPNNGIWIRRADCKPVVQGFLRWAGATGKNLNQPQVFSSDEQPMIPGYGKPPYKFRVPQSPCTITVEPDLPQFKSLISWREIKESISKVFDECPGDDDGMILGGVKQVGVTFDRPRGLPSRWRVRVYGNMPRS